MESSLGHKDTDETYYNSFGIFSTSCIKNRKAFQWSLSFALIAFLCRFSQVSINCFISGVMKRIRA